LLTELATLVSVDVLKLASSGLEVLRLAMDNIQWIGGPLQQKDIHRFVYTSLMSFSRLYHVSDLTALTEQFRGLKEEIEVTGASNANIDGYNLLCHYMAKPPSYMTVLRWVHYLGFKQDSFKKSYYIDGHENPSQIAHRNKFTNKYLTNHAPIVGFRFPRMCVLP
jgi:hypothetical protein